MKKIFHSICVFIAINTLASQLALADDHDDRIQSLEKRVEQLEKLLQAREAKPTSPGETSKPL